MMMSGALKKVLMVTVLAPLLSPFGAAAEDKDLKKEVIKVGHFSEIYGHIHQNPSKYSTSLTNISCGHPVRVYSIKDESGERSVFNKEWVYVSAGPYEGYIKKEYISDDDPECLQDRYSKFFDRLSLDITDMYYWGKLYDHFVKRKTKAR